MFAFAEYIAFNGLLLSHIFVSGIPSICQLSVFLHAPVLGHIACGYLKRGLNES
jgi:hypothetical protein